MYSLIWNKVYSTGNHILDWQHFDMLKKANGVLVASKLGNKALTEAFCEFIDIVQTHIAFEDEYPKLLHETQQFTPVTTQFLETINTMKSDKGINNTTVFDSATFHQLVYDFLSGHTEIIKQLVDTFDREEEKKAKPIIRKVDSYWGFVGQ